MKFQAGCALTGVVVLSSFFRCGGCYIWTQNHEIDSIVVGTVVAAIPGFGAWTAYSSLSAKMGQVWAAIVVLPSCYAEFYAALALFTFLASVFEGMRKSP